LIISLEYVMYTFQSNCPHTQHTPTGPGKNGKSIATHLTKHYNSFEIVLSSLWDRNPFIFPIQMQNSPQISSVSRCTIYRNVRDARVPNWILAYYTLFFFITILKHLLNYNYQQHTKHYIICDTKWKRRKTR